MAFIDNIKISSEAQLQFADIIFSQENYVEFTQSEQARNAFPCLSERIVDYAHILPETHFNVVDFDNNSIKTEVYFFGSNATAIAFWQCHRYLNYSQILFVVIANVYRKEYIDYIKENHLFVKRICLVFPKNIYGFIDDVKTLLYWENVISFDCKMKPGFKNMELSIDSQTINIDTCDANLTTFKRHLRRTLHYHKTFKTPLTDYKYQLNIYRDRF